MGAPGIYPEDIAMAQTGYTPILLYSSSTVSQAPSASNLTNSALGSELAINITDGKLFYKDNANAVQVIGWKVTPTTAGGTGLTSYTAGDLLYYVSGSALSKLGIGTNGQILKSTGTAPAWENVSALAVTSISFGTTGLTPNSATQGAVTVAGTLVAANGGTGQSSYTVGDILYASGTTALSKLADVATGNALISGGVGVAPSWGKIGLTTHVSGTLAVTNGGTGLATVAQGDILYGSASNTLSALAKNTTATRYLANTGTSNNPAWAQVDLSNGVTGTLPVGNGGTGATTFTAGRVLFGNTTSAINTSANLFWDNTNNRLGINTGSPGFALEVQSADTSGTAAEVLRLRASGGSNDFVDQTFFARGGFMSNPVVRLRGHLTLGIGGSESGQFVVATVSGGTLTDRFTVRSDGIIVSPATYSAVVGGTNRDVFVDNTGLLGYVSSTRESKANIQPMDDVSWLSKLQPKTFNRRKRNAQKDADGKVIVFEDGYSDELYDETEYGLVFDEVEPINPKICFYDDEEKTKPAGVSYSKLIVPLLKKVQQLEAEIKQMKEAAK